MNDWVYLVQLLLNEAVLGAADRRHHQIEVRQAGGSSRPHVVRVQQDPRQDLWGVGHADKEIVLGLIRGGQIPYAAVVGANAPCTPRQDSPIPRPPIFVAAPDKVVDQRPNIAETGIHVAQRPSPALPKRISYGDDEPHVAQKNL